MCCGDYGSVLVSTLHLLSRSTFSQVLLPFPLLPHSPLIRSPSPLQWQQPEICLDPPTYHHSMVEVICDLHLLHTVQVNREYTYMQAHELKHLSYCVYSTSHWVLMHRCWSFLTCGSLAVQEVPACRIGQHPIPVLPALQSHPQFPLPYPPHCTAPLSTPPPPPPCPHEPTTQVNIGSHLNRETFGGRTPYILQTASLACFLVSLRAIGNFFRLWFLCFCGEVSHDRQRVCRLVQSSSFLSLW